MNSYVMHADAQSLYIQKAIITNNVFVHYVCKLTGTVKQRKNIIIKYKCYNKKLTQIKLRITMLNKMLNNKLYYFKINYMKRKSN